MIQTLLAIATILGGLSALWFFWDRVSAIGWERTARLIGLRTRPVILADASQRGYDAAVRFLVEWLENDQDRIGHHMGQFGRHANLNEERQFQTGRETLSAKPRLYLTGWPCFILQRHGLAPRTIELAHRGLRQLLSGGVVRVSEGALSGMAPADRPTLISYRHTIRAIQILLATGEKHSALAETIGQILDPRAKWQNEDGGWAQCDVVFTASDLWASAYAASLLFSFHAKDHFSEGPASGGTERRLSDTLRYLQNQWVTSKWALPGSAGEQNAPLLFHEVSACLAALAVPLRDEILAWFKQWLTPAGTLSNSYYALCKDLAQASASARMAYVFHLAGESLDVWRPLYDAAVRDFGTGVGVNSADVAFLLDLTLALKNR